MKVLIQMLQGAEGIEGRLRTDGWKLETESPDWLSARHVSVPSEEDARYRLQELGLLTSNVLRIEFPIAALRATLKIANTRKDPRRN